MPTKQQLHDLIERLPETRSHRVQTPGWSPGRSALDCKRDRAHRRRALYARAAGRRRRSSAAMTGGGRLPCMRTHGIDQTRRNRAGNVKIQQGAAGGRHALRVGPWRVRYRHIEPGRALVLRLRSAATLTATEPVPQLPPETAARGVVPELGTYDQGPQVTSGKPASAIPKRKLQETLTISLGIVILCYYD